MNIWKKMENDNKPLEENLDLVNYIMLHRIYDILVLISTKIAGEEDTQKMVKYHEEGFLLGPSPSFRSDNNV
jgi:hypothetical protein